jgi:arylsulfatase A-like enzyme
LVISWPAKIKDHGGIRSQWHHVIDIVPTILEVTGLEQPSSVNGVAQKPIEGVSMAYTFDNPKAPSARQTQYFEMMGNRGIYHEGWVACTTPVRMPWEPLGPTVDVINGYKWELYHVADDFSEAVNVADKYPEKLHDL